jgi:hypothetical protein
MNDFRLVLKTVCVMFFTCAVLSVIVAWLDALHHFPLAEYLVKKFGDMLTLCVGASVGLLAGHRYGLRKERQQKNLTR